MLLVRWLHHPRRVVVEVAVVLIAGVVVLWLCCVALGR